MRRALEGLLAEGEEFAVFSTALEGPGPGRFSRGRLE